MALGRETLNLLWVLSTASSPAPPSPTMVCLLTFLGHALSLRCSPDGEISRHFTHC